MRAAVFSLLFLLRGCVCSAENKQHVHVPKRHTRTLGKPRLPGSPCKGKMLDFVFVIDSSRSIRPDDYERVKLFIKDTVQFLDVGEDRTRVGLLQYGSLVQNEFFFNAYFNKELVQQAVGGMEHMASGTMTGLALQFLREEAFSAGHGARPAELGVPRVAVVVTDGRPQDRVEEEAELTRQAGIEVFAVGVGRVDMATLRSIGSEPHNEHVFLVDSFRQIGTLISVFNSTLCTDVDLCLVVDHRCEHVCVSTRVSYVCHCRSGFVLQPDGKSCNEDDPCAVAEYDFHHLCVNVGKSYECHCRPGFELKEDGKICHSAPTTPPPLSLSLSSHQSVCVLSHFLLDRITMNTLMSLIIPCVLSLTVCLFCAVRSEIDFCDLGDHGCEHDCVSTSDSYMCRCRKGFRLHADGKSCRKLDSCAVGDHGCEHKCVNDEDSFSCRCRKGFTLRADGKTCLMDLCGMGTHGCEQKCVNTEDSFVCRCRRGFTLRQDGKTCQRVDLCGMGTHGCEHECVNTEDSFVCRCRRGFTLRPDDKTCQRVDICGVGDHGCEHECVNTEDSFRCHCRRGFILRPDGKTCQKSDCVDQAMDLMFVIDGSRSVGMDNFELVKRFVMGLVGALPEGTRVGLLQFSTSVQTEFTLGQYSSIKEVQRAVAATRYMGRGSRTGTALQHLVQHSFHQSRTGASRTAVLLTDGRSQDDVSTWASMAKSEGIRIYAVGVGKALEEELRVMASQPEEKHLYYAQDFRHMEQIAEKLKSRFESCEVQPPEDQCSCERLKSFQSQASDALKKITEKLEDVTKRIEVLESRRHK
ncbi:matrilin-1-like isoform X1 [Brachyhypopomus gauderio]|uniref:matrilin-1-like isoform X1 n=1 Tax=Brachyhypopomus gauderio TaxID=698409 RepID=UPI0040415173